MLIRKSIITIAASCVFILSSSTYSSASESTGVEVKLRGLLETSLDWGQGWGSFNDVPTLNRAPFIPNSRFRIWADFITSENLSATIGVQMSGDWGAAISGATNGMELDGEAPLMVKQAYLDYTMPNTDFRVRMGLYRVAIPGLMMGNAIMGDEATGITASYEVNENIEATAIWFRPYEEGAITVGNKNDTADFFTLLFPMNYDGFKITPWTMFGLVDADSYTESTNMGAAYQNPNDVLGALFAPLYGFYGADGPVTKLTGTAQLFWVGLHAKITAFDPFVLEIEADFGSTKGFNDLTAREGWIVAALAEYKISKKIVPGILAWYASGDDDNIHNGSENLPMITAEWATSNTGFGRTFQTRGVSSNAIGYGPSGTCAIGLQATMTLLPKLWQEIRFVYLRGTNDNSNSKYAQRNWNDGGGSTIFRGGTTNVYLTKADSSWEVNLTSIYQIQKNLKLVAELGYVDLDIDTSDKLPNFSYEDHTHRVSLSMIFSF